MQKHSAGTSTRRELLAASTSAFWALSIQPRAEPPSPERPQIGYCLNTAVLRGQKLELPQLVDLAARTGYKAIEPWLDELERYVASGGSLKELGQRLRDAGLAVPSAIAFARWIVNDPGERQQGFAAARKAMEMVRSIGGTGIAAPPAGATDRPGLNLRAAADRYAQLLELGRDVGVQPFLEVWGFSQNLSRVSEAAFVAIETGHPDATLLLDVYHIYKGGSSFQTLHVLNPARWKVFHMNDYPARPARDELTDAHRVYPGDGVAPLRDLVADMLRGGFGGYLSLELFNPTYWKEPAEQVARTGLQKMKAIVDAARQALAGQ
jgi:2-keto-myo-inositol isomerase